MVNIPLHPRRKADIKCNYRLVSGGAFGLAVRCGMCALGVASRENEQNIILENAHERSNSNRE